MRYYTYGVGAYLVLELEMAGAVDQIIHDGRDIIHVRLITGESLMIYLIDSPIPVYEIKNIVSENTAAGHHTLFILWADMLLPDHDTLVMLEDWHEALLALHDNTIYAYKIYMEQLYLFPMHFEPMKYRVERRVQYGKTLEVGTIRCSVTETDVKGIGGKWFTAMFIGGDPDAYHRRRAETLNTPAPSLLQEYYRVLGVAAGADRFEIKSAYRKLARQYHPDLNITKESTEKMQSINVAYAAILKSLGE